MKKTILLPLLLLSLLIALPLAAQDRTASLLDRALADPAGNMRQADGTYAVWVYFTDKGLGINELGAALDAVESSLPERTLRRRAKMTEPGQRLVDGRDLPVAPAYIAAVENEGAGVRRQSRWLNAASFDATRDQINAIAALPFVTKIDLVARFRRPTPPLTEDEQELSREALEKSRLEAEDRWSLNYGPSLDGLEQINVPPVHEMGITGDGVVIGMLDSGFKTTHTALSDIPVIARYDFVNDDEIVENEPGDPSTQHNHGTKTLSTIMGFEDGELVAPAFGATAILAKTEDISQEVPIEEDNWVAGLEWVESLGADVVSSSLGYYEWYEFADLDGNTAVTTIAADLAVGRGVCVVNSAGNERGWGFGHIIAPADGDSVITVGAVTLAGDIASFSSPGPTYDGRIKPDVSAQGVGNHMVSTIDDASYTIGDGTSFACPMTAGVAALVLSRAPSLDPLQVREALRMTSDRAGNPDNDFGWGILDAHAAVTYWGASIEHEPLGDTEDTGNPITVSATVTDRLPLDPDQMFLMWGVDGEVWAIEPLISVGGDVYEAAIPPQPAGRQVLYFLKVTDSVDITTYSPTGGSATPYTFMVGPDVTPPSMSHLPLDDQPMITWPPAITAEVTDNLGVDRVELVFTINGGPEQGPFLLEDRGGLYALTFPLSVDEVFVGDEIVYTVTAFDAAAEPNSSVSGPHPFEVIDTLGVVLVVDDSGAGARDVKYDERKNELVPRDGRSAATEISQWLIEAGYVADVILADAVGPDSFSGYQVVILSAGDNTSPLANAGMRSVVQDWVNDGGRIMIEGGEVGYDALSSPGYPDFAHDVLHADNWRTDNAGSLLVRGGQETHPFMIQPHALPGSVPIAYDGYGDEDAVDAASDALVIMGTSSYGESAGVLIYDDNSAPQAGQVVYFAFNLLAVAPETGRLFTENAMAYLLASEAPASAMITGTVSLAGSNDASGVTVSCGPGHSVVTGYDGHYELGALYAGNYQVVASKDGYAAEMQSVLLSDGQLMDGVDFALQPVLLIHAEVFPGLPIPDNNPGGVSSVITVSETGTLSDITVDMDISHSFIGDLTVTLTSPAGTVVTLHNGTGSNTDDILGNYPESITVDGPGLLADFFGESVQGDWTLFVVDDASSDSGTLNGWGIHLQVPVVPTSVGEQVPTVTRLAGNAPNPFNPQTVIAYDLARTGPVRLDVFDLRGRLVRRLVDESVAAGRHQVRWDGRDGGGREMASGVYLCRLHAAGLGLMQKMTLVR